MNRTHNHVKIRHQLSGTKSRPRLSVYRSLNNLFGQLIDDTTGQTLAAASSLKLTGSLASKAKLVGTELAKKASDLKIKTVVFDRGGFIYKGNIKLLADAAREKGLQF